jgi:hypothetical protein
MFSSADIALWVYATVLSVFVVFLIILRGQFRRFAALGMYFAIESAVSLLRMRVLSTYGITSIEYGYFYYYSDFLLSILLYFVVASLFQKAFPSLASAPYLRIGSVMLAAGVGIFSWAIVVETSSRVLLRWIVEYSQDIFVVSVFAAVALFGVATYKSDAPRPIYQLTFVFAGYFVFLGLMYMLRNLVSGWSSHNSLVGFFGMWLPLGVAYVFCDPGIGDSQDLPHPRL